MEKFIPLSIPNFEGNEEKYVLDAVHQYQQVVHILCSLKKS